MNLQTNRITNDLQNGAENSSYLLTQTDLNKYDLKEAVKLPEGENPEEWIANNIFNFHKQICMLYGTLNKFCTPESCPKMTAGKNAYRWEFGNESVEWPASKYIELLLNWVQEQLDNDDVFPSTSVDKKFPPDYMNICQTIAKRLSRVYAHIYHHHIDQVDKVLKVKAYMFTSLKHFVLFVKKFNLVTQEELEPLKECTKKFI